MSLARLLAKVWAHLVGSLVMFGFLAVGVLLWSSNLIALDIDDTASRIRLLAGASIGSGVVVQLISIGISRGSSLALTLGFAAGCAAATLLAGLIALRRLPLNDWNALGLAVLATYIVAVAFLFSSRDEGQRDRVSPSAAGHSRSGFGQHDRSSF